MDILIFDQFSAVNGVPATPPDFPEMHRNPRRPSKTSQWEAAQRVSRELANWQERRDQLRTQFELLKKSGAVREPTRRESLERTAKGEGAAAEAAKRILARGV